MKESKIITRKKALVMSLFGATMAAGVLASASAQEANAAPMETQLCCVEPLKAQSWSVVPLETQSRHWVDGKSPKSGLLN
ncbi:hypothetical protein AB0A63_24445 [Lentzea sp. NPDC042327]|uniref:hypothetical protein n=1 Tax=Lentzea sp. NPDC042327 TaxID=3154801 RepID=UPI0033F3912D